MNSKSPVPARFALSCRGVVSQRPGVPEDAEAISEVHQLSRIGGMGGYLTPRQLNMPDPASRLKRWTAWLTEGKGQTLVAESQDGVVGFCTWLPAPDGDLDKANAAELQALYVLPSWWGRQVGSALLTRAISEVRDRRHDQLVLWTLAINTRSRALYLRHGFRPDGRTKLDRVGDSPVFLGVRYALDLTVLAKTSFRYRSL